MTVSVAVITGTIGNPLLKTCIESVVSQTLASHSPSYRIQHWIVIDGQEYLERVKEIVQTIELPKTIEIKSLVLPENTGRSVYNAHRIYSAASFLVNTDYVSFLDEDNSFCSDHLESLMAAIEMLPKNSKSLRWAYSLRRIVDPMGNFVCNDCCESLGGISHTVIGKTDRLIDMNCYLIDRALAVETAKVLYNDRTADRHLTRYLLVNHWASCAVSRKHSVNYTVDPSRGGASVQPDFFVRGNNAMPTAIDSNKRDIYVFHFDAEKTAVYLALLKASALDPSQRSPLVLREWAMTLWDGLADDYNLLNGFSNLDFLPQGATCVVAMVHPHLLPLVTFRQRKDLRRILLTVESPNIRHQQQWSKPFLKEHFGTVLTFWESLLDDPTLRSAFLPHCSARVMQFPRDACIFRDNKGSNEGSVVMVLERRAGLGGVYNINGVDLRCLDPLREQYLSGLTRATVFGEGWDESFCDPPGKERPKITLGHSLNRKNDPQSSIDRYQQHDFVLIIENCDAEGYVSEKFGDALVAGAIPLYYGNPSDRVRLPEGAYVDIRAFRDGQELQQHLDTLTASDIARMKERVKECRQSYLEERGAAAVARAITRVIIP